jgi:tetratricopeptide (TPR) repeat protein
MNKIKYTAIFIAALLLFFSCSSAPKRSSEVLFVRTQAETLLDSGNREAGQGRFENALIILNESKRNAILADDPSMIIRCSLARGNVLFSLNRTEEAFSEWHLAISEAQRIEDRELVSAAKIFLARGSLFSNRASARDVLDEVAREAVNIKSNRQYIAFSWQVRGLAYRALGYYAEAENAARNSLAINEKDRYLENASYDWYVIASVRSLAGNTQGALQALESSIAIDRRIENSWGLASSWRAMGDVYKKMGNEQMADEAYRRSRVIYAAMGIEE